MKALKKLNILLLVYLFSSCNTEEQNVTIFAGDSLIRNWDVERYFPYLKTENRGVDGCTLEECLSQTSQDENASVVLLVGTNNLTREIKEISPLIEEYIKLIDSFHVKRIFCISILPRNNFPNDIIEHFNDILAKKLKTKENTVFVDVYDNFYWNGQMNPEYTIDGIHLSVKGYELLTFKLSKLL